jgi:antitoxin component of RelBE/YafQ-DinJ toxin-antitoxin module
LRGVSEKRIVFSVYYFVYILFPILSSASAAGHLFIWVWRFPASHKSEMMMTGKRMTGMMTPQMTPRESQVMSTIHFRIDEDVKRLAMRAAERQKMTLTEVMRQRAEELAAEERQYQDGQHDAWLEEQIVTAFSRYDAGDSEFISNDEMNARMEELKAQAARGTL